jgi:hypothetical protein
MGELQKARLKTGETKDFTKTSGGEAVFMNRVFIMPIWGIVLLILILTSVILLNLLVLDFIAQAGNEIIKEIRTNAILNQPPQIEEIDYESGYILNISLNTSTYHAP